MDKFVVKNISSGHLSSGVSPRLSFPASAGGNPQQFAPTKPECHHEYQGLWNSWTGHGAYCSQWQRIFLWSTSQGEIPQPKTQQVINVTCTLYKITQPPIAFFFISHTFLSLVKSKRKWKSRKTQLLSHGMRGSFWLVQTIFFIDYSWREEKALREG